MKYPDALGVGSKIAVCALSSGVNAPFKPRLELALNNLKNAGFKILRDPHLERNEQHVSADKKTRAKQLMQYLLDDSIDAIMPPWGGEFAMEILPLLDYHRLKEVKPKWLIGFSDISTVQIALTSILNWPTMHTSNLMQLVPQQLDANTQSFFNVIALEQGESFSQTQSSSYEVNGPDVTKDPEAPYNLTETTSWKTLNFPKAGISGRLIGGCLDTIISTLGTPYFDLHRFCDQYQQDGIILYLENAELSPTAFFRALLMLKFNGHLNRINALLLGRHGAFQGSKQISFQQALIQAEISVPIVYDMDIGHLAPNLTLINGAYCEIDRQLELKQTLV